MFGIELRRILRGGELLAGRRGYGFCQAEIENFYRAALGEENICRLDVAMDDAFGVCGVERVGDLNSYVDDFIKRHGTAADAMLQRLPIKVFHRDEPLAIAFIDFVDGADVRMIQRRSRLRLAFKTRQRLRIFSHCVRQEFQRHETVQLGIFGFIDDAHTAAAQFFDDAVVRDDLPNHGGAPRNIRLRGCLSQRAGSVACSRFARLSGSLTHKK